MWCRDDYTSFSVRVKFQSVPTSVCRLGEFLKIKLILANGTPESGTLQFRKYLLGCSIFDVSWLLVP